MTTKIKTSNIETGAVTADKLHVNAITDKLGFTPANTSSLATVATTGSYTDLTNKPTVTPAGVSNQENTSTGYFDLPAGSTAQRPVTPSVGMVRYNNDIGVLEQYTITGWLAIDSPPVISSFSGIINTDTTSTITINGSNFKSGSVVYIEGAATGNTSRALVTSFINSNQLTADTNATSVNYVGNTSYDIKVTNPSGLSGVLYSVGTVDRDPIWSTTAGNIATIYDIAVSSINVSVSASDPDGSAVTYSLVSGSLPTGLTLNASTGAITGSTSSVVSDTTYTFTLRATSNGQSIDRTFNIIIKAPIIVSFTSVGTQSWTVPSGLTKIAALVIGAGGGSGGNDGASTGGNGGGSGGGVYTIFNTSGGTSLSIAVGGGGTGGADTCNGYTVDASRGDPGTNGGGWGGRAGTSPCSGGGGGGGGWSGIYVGGTYYAVAGGGGGGGFVAGGGGGGGGATALGANAVTTTGGAGGAGYDVSAFIGGSALYKAGGGGGAGTTAGGAGGSSVGGAGGTTNGTAAAANTAGGGGGGVNTGVGANGGSGIVYVRWKV